MEAASTLNFSYDTLGFDYLTSEPYTLSSLNLPSTLASYSFATSSYATTCSPCSCAPPSYGICYGIYPAMSSDSARSSRASRSHSLSLTSCRRGFRTLRTRLGVCHGKWFFLISSEVSRSPPCDTTSTTRHRRRSSRTHLRSQCLASIAA